MKDQHNPTVTHDLELVQSSLRAGGCCIYPTETFYALGCNALNPWAVDNIFSLKSRPRSKPLPLIIGAMHQLEQLSSLLEPAVSRLIDLFWPGPLSILLKARAGLPRGLVNQQGYVCVRLTSHPAAQALCRACGFPLTASSANLSAGQPPHALNDIHPDLIKATDQLYNPQPAPTGRAPSTILQVRDAKRLKIVRTGAVDSAMLQKAGFRID